MATATEQPKAKGAADDAAALLSLLGDSEMPVEELLKAVPKAALSAAWARGDVEFGRTKHCLTGRPECPPPAGNEPPALIVEKGVEWTGPKKATGGRLDAILAHAKALPPATVFKEYVRLSHEPDGRLIPAGEERWGTVVISREKAAELLTLRVRLTDKGLATLQG